MLVPYPDECRYVKYLAGIPICSLNCGPCSRIDVKLCECTIDVVEVQEPIEIPESTVKDESLKDHKNRFRNLDLTRRD